MHEAGDAESMQKIQHQLKEVDAHIASAQHVIANTVLILNDGQISTSDLTTEERMAIGIALNTLGEGAAKIGGNLGKMVQDAKDAKVAAEIDALKKIQGNLNGPDVTGKAPNTVANQQALIDLKNGKLPGNPIGGPGTPREMPESLSPTATAQDFSIKALGRLPTADDYARGAAMNQGNCPGCWRGVAADGTVVIYRPAGVASKDTLPTTATVELNSPAIGNLNVGANGKPGQLKLKFPETGATGAAP